jgi:ribose 5-phosphate isomerase B
MQLAFGCDHAGFPLRQELLARLAALGHQVVDCGTHDPQPVDYPDIARQVGALVARGQAERGVLVCGSGIGAAIAVNKIPGVRAGLCENRYTAVQGVEHDDMNVVCLGARVIGRRLAVDLVEAFLQSTFSAEPRHVRRVAKIAGIERDACDGVFS